MISQNGEHRVLTDNTLMAMTKRELVARIRALEKMIEQADKEEWKPVRDFEGLYEVSNTGKVRNRKNGYELSKFQNRFGYITVCLNKDGKVIQQKVHRLVAEAFIPNPGNKPQVNHKNGNKADNTVGNLEWVNQSENMLHASRNGLRNTHKVMIVETGQVFPNITECARAINGSDADIHRCIFGTKSKTHKGYHFKLVEE